MSLRSAAIAALAPVCFVPAAVLGHLHEVHLYAFDGAASAIAKAHSIAPAPAAPLEAAIDVYDLPDANVGASAIAGMHGDAATRRSARPRGCGEWRPMSAGPSSRAASVGPVRMCEGAPDGRAHRIASAARVDAPSARPRRGVMEFVVDLRIPH